MLDKKYKLVRNLQKNIKVLEYNSTHQFTGNIKILGKRGIGIAGVFIKSISPTFAAAFLALNILQVTGLGAPIERDMVTEYPHCQTTYYSNGVTHTTSSLEDKYMSDDVFLVSTPWVLNEQNLYERAITTYQLNDLCNEDIEKILNREIDDLSQFYSVLNIKKVQTSNLTPEDMMYAAQGVMEVTVSGLDFDNPQIHPESLAKNIIVTLLYFIFCFGVGNIVLYLCKYNTVKNLQEVISKTPMMTKDNVAYIKEILQIRQDNLDRILGNVDLSRYESKISKHPHQLVLK